MALTKIHSVRDFLRIWFYWKSIAIFVFFVVVFLVLVYSYTATPIYQSTAKILVLPRTTTSSVISSGENDSRVREVTTKDINTEMELLYSNEVIEQTIKNIGKEGLGLHKPKHGFSFGALFGNIMNNIFKIIGLSPKLNQFEKEVQEIKNALEVSYNDDSDILFVSLKAEDPIAAELVLNALLTSYIKHHDQVFTKSEGVFFYRDQARQFRKKLNQAENALKKFQKENNIIDLTAQNEANISLLSDLNRRLKDMEIAYDEAATRIKFLKKALDHNHEQILITKEMRTIPAIVKLEESIVPLLIKRSEIQKNFTPQSREYRDMDEQIALLHNEILKEIKKAIRTDLLELNTLKIKIQSLKAKIKQLNNVALDLVQKQKKLSELQRQVDLYQKNYILYASKTEDARIENERVKRNLASVGIADPASASFIPVFPNRLLMFVLSIIFGLLLAIATPFVLESLDRKLKTSVDTEELLSLPVIATFPYIPKN